jgi:hypothetical protein
MPVRKTAIAKQKSSGDQDESGISPYLDSLNQSESLAKVNSLTILKSYPCARAEDLVIAFRSLFSPGEYPMEITHNISRTDIRTSTEFLYRRLLITKPGDPESAVLSLCGLLRGKENLFGLTKGDRNLELYNASKMEKHVVHVRDVKQVTDSLVVESSHRTRLEGHHLENNPDNFAEARYIEYAFPVEALGARTVTTTNKSDGKKSVLAVEYANKVFIREYYDPETLGWRNVTCGLFVQLNESSKVNQSRMSIIKGLVDQLDHLC